MHQTRAKKFNSHTNLYLNPTSKSYPPPPPDEPRRATEPRRRRPGGGRPVCLFVCLPSLLAYACELPSADCQPILCPLTLEAAIKRRQEGWLVIRARGNWGERERKREVCALELELSSSAPCHSFISVLPSSVRLLQANKWPLSNPLTLSLVRSSLGLM